MSRIIGAPVEPHWVSLRAGDTKTPEYRAMNPKGQVPVLQFADGAALTEIPAIALALHEMTPGSTLFPAGGIERLRAFEQLAWCHFTMPAIFFPAFAGARMAGGDEAAGAALRAAAPKRILAAMRIAEGLIGDGTSLVQGTPGDAVRAADVFLWTLVRFCGFLKVDVSEYAGVVRVSDKVARHPGTVRALDEEKAEDARRAALQAPSA
ncbi:glutathione S-transferase family protein [Roseomonas sp. CCTCC AB2023176]|uniref:glutathione S-transferase family protein n=1 Tax=Roseomonas sp. CCTCC AB2023176 TaxID=3342640 RepID=UPI0035DF0D81